MRPTLFAAAVLCACSSTVTPSGAVDGGADASSDARVLRDGAEAGRDVQVFDTAAYDVFRDDACPGSRPPPQRDYRCDPFAAGQCPPGEGCYVFIEYPSQRCGSETYRSLCLSAGDVPGDGFCNRDTRCAPGFSCFVTGASNRCLQLCRLDGAPPQCPRGRVCEPTDLPDYGACD